MTVYEDMIDLIEDDRARWSHERSVTIRSWDKAFRTVHSSVLMEAAASFLKHQKGNPTIQKLQAEIDRVKKPARTGRAHSSLEWQDHNKNWDQVGERRKLDQARAEGRDPVRNWLLAHGVKPVGGA